MRRRDFDDDDEEEEEEEEAAARGGLRAMPLVRVRGVRERTTFFFAFEEMGALLRGKSLPILLVTPTAPQQHSTACIWMMMMMRRSARNRCGVSA